MVAYLLKNLADEYLDKHGEWLRSAPRTSLALFRHRDEALNHLIELNAKQPLLRATVVEAQLDARQRPIVIDERDPASNSDCAVRDLAELA